MHKILALDLSTTGAGYAVFKGDKLIKSGTIKPKNPITSSSVAPKLKKKLNMDARCHEIIEYILKLLNESTYDAIIVEDTFSGKDPYCFKWLCRLQGVVVGYAANKIPVTFKTPTEWRKTLKIPMTKSENGKKVRLKNADLKALDISYVVEHLGYTPIDDNEADAICIGLSYFEKN